MMHNEQKNIETEKSFYNKLIAATKWSSLSEIIAKLLTPITSMILARILAPEIFGIVASINVVISFCDLFTDAGFQKYIIQHETQSDVTIESYANVAFWTNLVISFTLWGLISLVAEPVATIVGCQGKSMAIIVACANLPLTSFSSIQMALLKREMNFKPLFYSRIITIFVPVCVTVPLAIMTRSYWAMIAGTIATNLITVLTMLVLLKWRPKFQFRFYLLKRMFDFSIWSLLESVLVWMINWGDVFIVSGILSSYYLGLYKTSMNLINQVFATVSAATVPVLLSALSRLQNDDEKFRNVYYRFSFYSGLLLIPMGVGLFVFRDTVCVIGLGEEWLEASTLMGTWGLVSAVAILLNSYNGNVLIAKGRPKLSVVIQIVQIAFIVPAVYIGAKTGFENLSYLRAAVRVVGMIVHCLAVKRIADISFKKVMFDLLPSFVATAVMGVFGWWFVSLKKGLVMNLGGIFICIVLYAIVAMMFPSVRSTASLVLNKLNVRIKSIMK